MRTDSPTPALRGLGSYEKPVGRLHCVTGFPVIARSTFHCLCRFRLVARTASLLLLEVPAPPFAEDWEWL